LQKKRKRFPEELIKYILNLCLEQNQEQLALDFAEQKNLYINYIDVLIQLKRIKQALNYIRALSNRKIEKNSDFNPNDSSSSNVMINLNSKEVIYYDEIIEIFNTFISIFLIDEEQTAYTQEFLEIFIIFISKNYKIIEEQEMNKLLHRFLYLDYYFITIFEQIKSYKILLIEPFVHRRIELYLDEMNEIKDEKDKNKIKVKILDLLSNTNYKIKYDFDYVLFLFQKSNFSEGIEFISIQSCSYKTLLYILYSKKDYKKILHIFIQSSPEDESIWVIALQMYLKDLKDDTISNEQKNIIKKNLQEFLLFFLESKLFTSIEILDMIYELNNELSIEFMNKFYFRAIELENKEVMASIITTKDLDVKIQDAEENIDKLKNCMINVSFKKCDECNKDIKLPYLIFKCGHQFHLSCLNLYFLEDEIKHCVHCYKKPQKKD
jgi:hypothetical protein